jgi:H+/Cl- antiporter ClcA
LSSSALPSSLGDFNVSPRLVLLSALAIPIGVLSTFVAYALLNLIRFFTNAFFFARISTREVNIGDAHIGPAILIIPVLGGLVIGLMARYGSERIRGHGIPEAIEAILINRSRVQPRVAFLKPLSSAISIGSGGPFGAEGPIILTGGAFGSIVAQFLHVSSYERRTLLVAGAAAGMSATFDAPVASVLLAAELLLFEWRPRSLIPVGVASATAAVMRQYLLVDGPIFPVPAHHADIGFDAFGACLLAGLSAGVLAMALTSAVYASEDAFHKLPIHWMWWPAIGGLAIGLGGLVFPEALGVGYPVIRELLSGDAPMRIVLGVIIVKSAIWAISLGSGTSGGVLAPLLMIGCSVGALEAPLFPSEGPGFWPMVTMGAVLGGTMRSPLTGVVFVLELTHDVTSLLPVLLAVMVAHGFTVLMLRRSILTEKLSRRGMHLGREYAPDPLENALVRAVMRTSYRSLPAEMTLGAMMRAAEGRHDDLGGELHPVVDSEGRLVATVNGSDLVALMRNASEDGARPLGDLGAGTQIVAFPGESVRAVAERMALTGRTELAVVESAATMLIVGVISLRDVLGVRARLLAEENERERVLGGTVFRRGMKSAPSQAQ